MWGPTPADREACLAQIRPLRNDGSVHAAESSQGTLSMPSNIGGAHWGGVTFDPARQIVVVPVNRIPAFVQLIPLDKLDTADMRAEREPARRPIHADARHAVHDAPPHC